MMNAQGTLSAAALANERRVQERDQSLARLRYLEEMIERSSKEELAYAIKLLATVLADADGSAACLDQRNRTPTEADLIHSVVLHASIAIEKAKKGVDPTVMLLRAVSERA